MCSFGTAAIYFKPSTSSNSLASKLGHRAGGLSMRHELHGGVQRSTEMDVPRQPEQTRETQLLGHKHNAAALGPVIN